VATSLNKLTIPWVETREVHQPKSKTGEPVEARQSALRRGKYSKPASSTRPGNLLFEKPGGMEHIHTGPTGGRRSARYKKTWRWQPGKYRHLWLHRM